MSSEPSSNRLAADVNQQSKAMADFYTAQEQITDTLQTFARGLVALKDNQEKTTENMADLQSVQRMTIETIAQLQSAQEKMLDNMERLCETVNDYAKGSSEEILSLKAALERLDRVIDYLLRRDGESHPS